MVSAYDWVVLLLLALSPFLLIIALGLLVALVVPLQRAEPVHYHPHRGASPVSFLVAAVCLALALFAPGLPLRERGLFLDNRADYEHLVDLAQAGTLPHGTRCQGAPWFSAPPGYERLVGDSCIVVQESTVAFRPYYRFVVLVWSSIPNTADDSACNGGKSIWDRIDSHWSVCYDP